MKPQVVGCNSNVPNVEEDENCQVAVLEFGGWYHLSFFYIGDNLITCDNAAKKTDDVMFRRKIKSFSQLAR